MARIQSFYKVMVDQQASDMHRGICGCQNVPFWANGPTGSGKSTTLTTITHQINRIDAESVVTLPDPFKCPRKGMNCDISQREIGTHSESFTSVLRSTSREVADAPTPFQLRSNSLLAEPVFP